MDALHKFKETFAEGSQAQHMGLKLRRLILTVLDRVEENSIGGTKVKLTLYTRGGPNQVLCGLQAGKGDSCYLYVHHLPQLNHPRLRYSGKGKYARRIAFTSVEEIVEEDILWLLKEVEQHAPY